MKPNQLVKLSLFAAVLVAIALAGACSRAPVHERRATGLPPAAPQGGEFEGLAVVNGKPYADTYFQHYGVNPTVDTEEEPLSTFSADVDTASYSLARGYLQRGHLPEEAAVRVEEFVNAFRYAYADPGEAPFAVQVEGFPSPNRKGYHVLKLGMRAREITAAARKPALLVFTVDVSGSMAMENRLGLVKRSLALLLESLDERDQVALVVYGTKARVVLEPTSAAQRQVILAAIESLEPEGSTNVQAGLALAYRMAAEAPAELNRRVLLLSDGVANSGVTDGDRIFETVRAQASKGVALTAVGFGMGNYNDVLMERLAQRGDGQYAYVDRLSEARRLFVEQATGTLQLVAKDVKLQVQFDSRVVARYRLLGYENRMLRTEDFANDRVDAGDLGAGHTVTALYEVKLRDGSATSGAPLGTFRVRYKAPEGGESRLFESPLPQAALRPEMSQATGDAQLAFLVAQFAEKLRGSYWVRNVEWSGLVARYDALPAATRARPEVAELRELIDRARKADARTDRFAREVPADAMDFDHVPVVR